MGLHIYFCDICGVRVTDVDLRSGHGLLRGHQVMCGTCVGMGHGQSWLQGTEAASAGGPVPSHPLIDAARDRAQTVPDPIGTGVPRQDTHDTVRVPSASPVSDLSSVAASLGAMSSAPAETSSLPTDDVPDVQDLPQDGMEHPAAPFVARADGEESSALQPAVRVSAPSSSSSRRRAAAATPTPAPGHDSGKRRSSTSSKSPSARQAKPKTAKSARTEASTKPKLPLPVVVTVIGLLVIGTGAFMMRQGVFTSSAKPQVVELSDVKDQLYQSIKDARIVMNEALESRDVAKLKQARVKFQAAQDKCQEFERWAKQANWTEENIEVQLEGFHFEDLKAKDHDVRLELVKHGGL